MANVSRVNGFRPAKSGNGAPWNGQLTRYFVASTNATNIFVGDLVSLDGTADVNGVRGLTKTAIGGAAVGTIVQVDYNMVNLNSPQYRPGSQAMYVYVADDPNTVYECQASGTIAATTVGMNANHADAGGSTTTGQSGETVDFGTAAVTATLTLKILDFVQSPENEVAANAKVRVKINNHQLAGGTGTAGI